MRAGWPVRYPCRTGSRLDPDMEFVMTRVVGALALIVALLVIRWMTHGPGNLTDNDFRPPPFGPSSPAGSASR